MGEITITQILHGFDQKNRLFLKSGRGSSSLI